MPELSKVNIDQHDNAQDGIISVAGFENQDAKKLAGSFYPLEAIRKEIIEKQREQLRLYLRANYLELQERTKSDQEFKLFLANLSTREKQLVDEAFGDEKLKQQLERIEIKGYRDIHANFSKANYPNGFTNMTWQAKALQANTRAQGIYDDSIPPQEICTLIEKTSNANNLAVVKGDGSKVTIQSYRSVDFPISLVGASGSIHLSLAAKDQNGKNIAKNKAVYFTAHYENGKLLEVSSPTPVKFSGNEADSIGYIEQDGKIYWTEKSTQKKK